MKVLFCITKQKTLKYIRCSLVMICTWARRPLKLPDRITNNYISTLLVLPQVHSNLLIGRYHPARGANDSN